MRIKFGIKVEGSTESDMMSEYQAGRYT